MVTLVFMQNNTLSKQNQGIFQITSFNPLSMFICKYNYIIGV